MRVCFAGALLCMTLVGCQQTSLVNPPWTPVDRVTEAFHGEAIQRSSRFQLPRDSRAMVAVLAESRLHSESVLINAARITLNRSRSGVHVAQEPLLADEADRNAQGSGAQFLLSLRIVEWPDDGDKHPATCPYHAQTECNVVAGGHRMIITLRVDDVVTGRIIDTLSITTDPSRLLSSSSALDDQASAMVDQLLGAVVP